MNHLSIKYKYGLYCVLAISLLQSLISDYIGFRQINYLCDALLLLLLGVMMFRKQIRKPDFRKNPELISIAAFAVIVVAGWVLNDFSVLKALWSVRNYGRFFLFYCLLLACWDENDAISSEKIFIWLFPVHMLLIAFQYFVEGLNADNLSGLFGKVQGGNGGLMIYLSIVFCIFLCQYEYKKIGLPKFLALLLLMVANAVLSELKFFFVLAAFLVFWYVIIAKRKKRAILLTLIFIVVLYIGVQTLYLVFPVWKGILSIDYLTHHIWEHQSGYTYKFEVGRTSVFSKMTPMILNWGGTDALFFGIGLGNGDYSGAFPFLNSAFYDMYGYTQYTNLSLGYLFAETGFLGIIAYVSLFVILEVKAIIAYRKCDSYYNMLATFFPLVCMSILVYNSTLRSNYGYIIFAVLVWQTLMAGKGRQEEMDNELGFYKNHR